MPGIWSRTSEGWKLLAPTGFALEAELHDLVEGAPHLLPLADSPQLTVLGREVQLGPGHADLVAVESGGRIVLVEVKLAKNAEARRAIVTQTLAYAAYLHGLDLRTLEQQVLAAHLKQRKCESVLEAVKLNEPLGVADDDVFVSALSASLAEGRFRLVLVLDEAPPELVRLVAYLEAVADRLLVDLITVSAFTVGATTLLLPQRVSGETPHMQPTPTKGTSRPFKTEETLLEGFSEGNERDAVAALLDAARRAGAHFFFGPSGASVRVKSAWKQAVTVAWHFPPGEAGFMRTKDLSFGWAWWLDDEPPSALKAIGDPYYEAFAHGSVGEDVSGKRLRAWSLTAAQVADRQEDVVRRVESVIRELASLQ